MATSTGSTSARGRQLSSSRQPKVRSGLSAEAARYDKETAVQLVADQRIEVLTAVGATFDIPLDDPETLQAFPGPRPKRIQRVIEQADAVFLRKQR